MFNHAIFIDKGVSTKYKLKEGNGVIVFNSGLMSSVGKWFLIQTV